MPDRIPIFIFEAKRNIDSKQNFKHNNLIKKCI